MEFRPFGHRRWVIADGYIPAWGHEPEPEMASHEAACMLNAADREAHVRITIYFEDREPAGPYQHVIAPRRTSHLRFNELQDPEPIPRGKGDSAIIDSDVPIVVQQTRLDSRQAENAVTTTIAFPCG